MQFHLLLPVVLVFSLVAVNAQTPLGTVGGAGISVFGRVYLPNGKPASRVKVYLEMPSGLSRYIPTDDGGNYEFRGIERGRYKIKAVNPDAPEQYSDPAESDSNRAYANRVQIDVYLRLPMHKDKTATNAEVIHAADAAIPKAARQAFELGLKAQKENQSGMALTLLNQAIDLHPDYVQALTERGNLRMQQNQLIEAEKDFVRALELNAKYVPALRGIGYCQIQQKNFAAAVSNLENAFVLEPTSPLTLMLLGYGNLSLNRYEAAKQCLLQALKLGTEAAARAHLYLAEVYAHEQKFKEAADAVRAYLKAKPEAADAAQLQKLEADWRARSQ
jgi:tetratricopeptide (TPR) repeat protein